MSDIRYAQGLLGMKEKCHAWLPNQSGVIHWCVAKAVAESETPTPSIADVLDIALVEFDPDCSIEIGKTDRIVGEKLCSFCEDWFGKKGTFVFLYHWTSEYNVFTEAVDESRLPEVADLVASIGPSERSSEIIAAIDNYRLGLL